MKKIYFLIALSACLATGLTLPDCLAYERQSNAQTKSNLNLLKTDQSTPTGTITHWSWTIARFKKLPSGVQLKPIPVLPVTRANPMITFPQSGLYQINSNSY